MRQNKTKFRAKSFGAKQTFKKARIPTQKLNKRF